MRLVRLLAFSLVAACGSTSTPPAVGGKATVVHATRAAKQPVFSWVYGQGTAIAVRRKALYFQLDGRVDYIAAGPEGRELRPGDAVVGPEDDELLGQLIARIDDRDVSASVQANRAELQRTQGQRLSAEAQLKGARAELEAAQRDLATAERLLAAGTGTQQEVDNARTRVDTARSSVDSAKSGLRSAKSGAQAQKAQVTRSELAQERAGIFAPFDGVIAALNIKQGDYSFGAQPSADPGQQLRNAPIVVIDPSEFEIEIELPQYEAANVEVGQAAFVMTGPDVTRLEQSSDPTQRPEELVTRGSVFAVSPSVDPAARSILVTVRVEEQPERLHDGEFVTCFIQTAAATDAVSIPYDAFVREDELVYAFVVGADGKTVERRDLALGLVGAERVEVREGLAANDLVVTRGRRSLGHASEVEVTRIDGEAPPKPTADDTPEAQP